MYYKIYKDNEILDVITNPLYFKRNRIGKAIACSRSEAEGMLSSDGGKKWFIDVWAKGMSKGATCSFAEITYQEYELLKEALEQSKEEPSKEILEKPVLLTDITNETIQQSKIRIMNQECSDRIIKGIDVLLSDNQTYHFDLTIEDQINLLSLQTLVNDGMEFIPYHSKGEEAKLFTSKDMQTILDAVTKHRLYHITYFNALKGYISKITDIDILAKVHYGMSLPEEYQTEALKSLLK